MPTIKQKLAFKKMLENGGVVSRAMKDANYSAAMAKNPQKLTTTNGWQELMDKYLPDHKLIKKIEQGLEAKKIQTSHTEPDRIVDDWNIQHKFTETALKIKGKLNDNTEPQVSGTYIININEIIGLRNITSEAEDSNPDSSQT